VLKVNIVNRVLPVATSITLNKGFQSGGARESDFFFLCPEEKTWGLSLLPSPLTSPAAITGLRIQVGLPVALCGAKDWVGIALTMASRRPSARNHTQRHKNKLLG